MTIEHDIERIRHQERRLRFERFDNASALALGTRLVALGERHDAKLTIEIRLVRETVFFYAMPGTTPANADWARRKRNTVELLQRSSYRAEPVSRAGGVVARRKNGLADARLCRPRGLLSDLGGRGGLCRRGHRFGRAAARRS